MAPQNVVLKSNCLFCLRGNHIWMSHTIYPGFEFWTVQIPRISTEKTCNQMWWNLVISEVLLQSLDLTRSLQVSNLSKNMLLGENAPQITGQMDGHPAPHRFLVQFCESVIRILPLGSFQLTWKHIQIVGTSALPLGIVVLNAVNCICHFCNPALADCDMPFPMTLNLKI